MLHIKPDPNNQSLDIINQENESFSQIKYTLGTLGFTVPQIQNEHIPHIENEKLNLGVLPSMVRYLSDDHRIIIYERQPEIRHILYHPVYKANVESGSTARERSITLALPWQVYIVVLNNHYEPIKVHLYARPSKIDSINSKLYVMPLLNVYGDCSLCAPLISSMNVEKITTVAEALDVVYHMIWSSGFNYDLINSIQIVESAVMSDPGLQDRADEYRKNIIGDTAESFFLYWTMHMTNLSNFIFCNPSESPNGNTSCYIPYNHDEDTSFMFGKSTHMRSTFTVAKALQMIYGNVIQEFGFVKNMNISDYITAATEYGNETVMSV